MCRFSTLARYLFRISDPMRFRGTDGRHYTRTWSLLSPMTYDEWLYWHFDPEDGEVNPLVEDDDLDDEDDEYEYVEKTGPPLPVNVSARSWSRARGELTEQRLGKLDRQIRDLAALAGVYVLPTPPEKA